jgi:SAM-dependent methyltransferase
MKDIRQILETQCYGKPLEARRHWYSPSALAYHQTRPRYPQTVIEQVFQITELTAASRILEVGCGPAIATLAFATLGCEMLCLEPNPDFYALAQQTCAALVNVQLKNCAFEEWQPQEQAFDAVLAASSFHWVNPEIGYAKVAQVLKPNGHFIMLWNNELQPSLDLYQKLSPVYQTYAPSLSRAYEDIATQVTILDTIGQMALESGYFGDLVSGWEVIPVSYSIDQYLTLLSTYSPFLQLSTEQQQNLRTGLRDALNQQGDQVRLSFVSAFHIVQPNSQKD